MNSHIFRLPDLKCPADAIKAFAAIAAGVATGELTTREGNELAGLVGNFAKVIEIEELENRINALERMAAGDER